jgi:D-serine deaminase-like pyridoxal phosphate-dependent protein
VRLPDEVTTPATVVDVDRLEANLAAMARRTADAGLALRPHAKTHKCPPIALRQLALGAAGVAVATVAEAEAMAGAGVDDIFIAYPVLATGTRTRRLAALAERVRLTVGVDSPAGAAQLARAVGGMPLTVLIEVDCGHHRTGVGAEQAAEVARAARRAGLSVAGVFTFPGHGYRPGAIEAAALDEDRALDRAAAGLEGAGLEARVRSGGSTPTVARTVSRAATEVRPGVYAMNDAQQLVLGTCTETDVALVVVASVVSVPAPDRVVLDAGSKVLGADRPDWVPGFGVVAGVPGAVVGQLSEHHAVVTWPPDGPPRPAVGDRLAVIPNHVCSAVNLVDELVVVSRGIEVDRWPVAARGANH